METATGAVLTGEQAQAHAQPLAYGGHPCEHVAFIGCHDNLTMFDAVRLPISSSMMLLSQ
jgi:pullulanase/glycogen debranching enzyme